MLYDDDSIAARRRLGEALGVHAFRSGCVYLLAENPYNGSVKIGKCKHNNGGDVRIREIASLAGLPLVLAAQATCYGMQTRVETKLHRTLKNRRLIGEWFALDDSEYVSIALWIRNLHQRLEDWFIAHKHLVTTRDIEEEFRPVLKDWCKEVRLPDLVRRGFAACDRNGGGQRYLGRERHNAWAVKRREVDRADFSDVLRPLHYTS